MICIVEILAPYDGLGKIDGVSFDIDHISHAGDLTLRRVVAHPDPPTEEGRRKSSRSALERIKASLMHIDSRSSPPLRSLVGLNNESTMDLHAIHLSGTLKNCPTTGGIIGVAVHKRGF